MNTRKVVFSEMDENKFKRKTVNTIPAIKFELGLLKKKLALKSESLVIAYLIEHYEHTYQNVKVIDERNIRQDTLDFYGKKRFYIRE